MDLESRKLAFREHFSHFFFGDLVTIRELIQHQRTGMMVQPNDVAGLANTLSLLMEDEDLRAKLSRAGRQMIEDEFSLDSNVSRLLEAMNTLSPCNDEIHVSRMALCQENTA